MNEGIHLDQDTWIVPGQIRKANLYIFIMMIIIIIIICSFTVPTTVSTHKTIQICI